MSKGSLKKFIKIFVVSLVAVFLLLVPVGAFPGTADASIVQVKVTPEYKQTVARSQLSMLNSWRAGSNWYYNSSNSKVYLQPLKALKYDYTLEKYAMQRAAEIAVSFDHLRPKGDKKHGLSGYAVGENILASSRPDAATAMYAFTQFKEEDKNYSFQGHRRNMLSVPCAYDAVGIACIYYKGYYFWVQEFGKVSNPDTTVTTAINGTKTMTVDIESSDVYDSKVDLTEYNSWDAILKKGVTDYLPQVGLEVKMFDTVGKNGYAEVVAVPTWSSSNSGVTSVNSNAGTITGVSTGSSSVTMKESLTNTTKSKTVTVTDPNAVTGVSLNKTTLELNPGSSSTLTATVTPSAASNKNVTWSSSNTAVATVSSSGVVKGVKAGTATITVRTAVGGKTATCKVTVKDVVPTGISLNKSSMGLSIGNTGTLTASITPSNASNKNVNWTSSNPQVVSVDSNGVVTAKSEGTATITAKTVSGGKSATCKVTTKRVAVTGIKLNKSSWGVAISSPQALTATISPSDASNKKVTWKSSDTSIATVDSNGRITGKKIGGLVTITATTEDGKKSASCKVRILYDDIPSSYANYKEVYWGAELDLFADGNSKYNPSTRAYRYEIIDAIWKMRGKPAVPAGTKPYTDISPSEPYYEAAMWAKGVGMFIPDAQGNFNPMAGCPRQELALFFWRLAGQPEPTKELVCNDLSKSSRFYKALAWANERKIIMPDSTGKLAPSNICSRRVIVVYLYRFR